MTKAEQAIDFFGKGFNCAQSVLAVFCRDLGLDKKTALHMASPFGAGMRQGEVCGAVSGALMVLGLSAGFSKAEDLSKKQKVNKLSEEFVQAFKTENESIICRELLGYDISLPKDYAILQEKGLFKNLCPVFRACPTG